MTHKSTRLRIYRRRNRAGRWILVDLQGNSYARIWSKASALSLAKFLQEASAKVKRWARDYNYKGN